MALFKGAALLVVLLCTSLLSLKLLKAGGEALPTDLSSITSHVPKESSCPKNAEASRHDKIGVTGVELQQYFKRVIELDHIWRSSNRDVSFYYDEFVNYLNVRPLRSIGPCPAVPACDPERSAVSKLTKDVNVLKHVHSHNDYWRALPLFEALSYGVASVEADVWLVNNDTELAVGHNEAFLDAESRNLETLYTGPILSMLEGANCRQFESDEKYGVFYNSPETTLYLYIDFKSEDSTRTYDLLISKYLKPLIDSGYVSYFDMETRSVVWNPLTVVLTGDYPETLDVLDHGNDDGYYHSMQRFVFLDAPLHKLDQVDPNLSVVASCSLEQLLDNCTTAATVDAFSERRSELSSEQLECMWPTIKRAHELNLKTRLWGVPDWPRYKRDNLWRQQVEVLDIDFLNVDDLAAIAQF